MLIQIIQNFKDIIERSLISHKLRKLSQEPRELWLWAQRPQEMWCAHSISCSKELKVLGYQQIKLNRTVLIQISWLFSQENKLCLDLIVPKPLAWCTHSISWEVKRIKLLHAVLNSKFHEWKSPYMFITVPSN